MRDISHAPRRGVQDPAAGLDKERLARLESEVRKAFSENDFHAADMRTLAREAGMGFNTIYKYFGGKEGLLFYFVRRWQDGLNNDVSAAISRERDAAARLNTVVRMLLDYYEANPDIGKILFLTLPMTTWMSNESFAQRALINTVLTVIKDGQTQGVVRRDVPAVAILDMLLGMVHRAFTMWVYREGGPPLTAQAADLTALFRAGIDAKPR